LTYDGATPGRLLEAAFIAISSTIYILGGNMSGARDEVYKFITSEQEYEKPGKLLKARFDFSVIKIDNKILCVGG